MKKLLVTIATENILPHCGEILETQSAYAAANGYEYRLVSDLHWKDMHPSFSKVWEIHRALEEGYDFFIWADADVAFMDPAYDFLKLLEPDYFVAAYQQTNWRSWKYLCNGLFIMRNTQQAKAYVKEWMRRCELRTMVDMPYEQWFWDELMRETNWANIRCCTAAEIGCFSSQIWHDGTIWQPGMPTVHLGGPADWPRRRQVFVDNYLPLVKRA